MVRARQILVAVTCLAVVFAGCTSDGEGDGPDADDDGTSPAPGGDGDDRKKGGTGLGTGSRPLWFPGLTWTYDVSFPTAGVEGTLRLFVASEDGTSFRVTTDAEPELITWALHHRLPIEATVDQETFTHTLVGTDADLFGFPIKANETWDGTDPWGGPMAYSAEATTATIHGDHEVPAFLVTGRNDALDHFEYVYTAEAAYVVSWSYDRGGDGRPDAQMTLIAAEASGEHLGQDLLEVEHALHHTDEGVASNTEPASSFAVPDDRPEVHLVFTMTGDLGHYIGALSEPDGTEHTYNWTNTEGGLKRHLIGDTFVSSTGDGGAFGSQVLGDGTVVGDLYLVGRTPVSER